MVRSLLIRGMLVGLLAGLAAVATFLLLARALGIREVGQIIATLRRRGDSDAPELTA